MPRRRRTSGVPQYIHAIPRRSADIHPRIAELTHHLAGTRAELGRVIDAVPDEYREAPPPIGGWSVAEVVDHLAKIERSIAGLFVRLVAAGREQGLGAETDEGPILEGFKGHRIHNRKIKVDAPQVGIPMSGANLEDAWAALTAARRELLRELQAADGLALGTISYAHRNLGEMSLYQWIAFVGFHETRHTLQIEEIAASFTSPAHVSE